MSDCSTTIYVRSAFTEDNIAVNCSTPASSVSVGEVVDIPITVTNNNERRASIVVDTKLGGDVLETTELLVQGGLTVDFAVSIEPLQPGEYEIGAEAVSVSEP